MSLRIEVQTRSVGHGLCLLIGMLISSWRLDFRANDVVSDEHLIKPQPRVCRVVSAGNGFNRDSTLGEGQPKVSLISVRVFLHDSRQFGFQLVEQTIELIQGFHMGFFESTSLSTSPRWSERFLA